MDERRPLFLLDPLPWQQDRRAGDHGLHALLRAAHPERRALRVPEVDRVLGRREPAGRRISRLRHGAAEACLPRDPASAARARAAGGPRPLGRRSTDEGAGDVLRR